MDVRILIKSFKIGNFVEINPERARTLALGFITPLHGSNYRVCMNERGHQGAHGFVIERGV